MILDHNDELCPGCGESLQGEPIPELLWSLYGSTHFNVKKPVYSRSIEGMLTGYKCPYCDKIWDLARRLRNASDDDDV